MYTNPSFEKFSPCTRKTSLACGCKADWYIHDNVDACLDADLGDKPRTENNIMWAKAYFAEIGWHDKYADYTSNSWVGQLVSGPYPTEQEALAAAEAYIAEHYPEQA